MAKATTDHGTIQRWVEERGGWPARVKRTGGDGDPGILRIDFPGFSGEKTLERMEWEPFFEWFDENELAFIYQDRTSGGRQSRFNKLVSRETVDERARARSASSGGATAKRAGGAGSEARKASGGKRKAAKRDRGAGKQNPSSAPDIGAGRQEDALSMLQSQHRQVEALADELADLDPRSDEFRDKFLALADALAIHTTIEERIFYPGVKRDETAALLENSVDEHLRAKRVLATLMESMGGEDAEPELEELAGLTEEHIIEEEHELFPQVRKLVDSADLVELARRMRDLAAELEEEGEPRQHVSSELEEPAAV
ncbi:MAG TPA: hemerythrin domain-containing protein [Polyangia bacterium]